MERKVGAAIAGVAAAVVIGAAAVGVVTSDSSSSSPTAELAAAATPVFAANFATPGDFFDRFDFGLSGGTPAGRDDPNVPGAGEVFPMHGDHDASCAGPNTSRDVSLSGETYNGSNFPVIDSSQMFWWCAPSGDGSSGHVMTGINTLGYNHLWFSPKLEYAGITKVCWDINETTMNSGKWTEVQFVSHDDATRYPAGSQITGPGQVPGGTLARGSGGFDLGYTQPAFRPVATGGDSTVGPNNGLEPQGGTLAGLQIDLGTIFQWFQGQDHFTATGVGWPGRGLNGDAITDKAARFTTCIENVSSSNLQITNARPDGTFTYVIPGQIPQDARRVVFHDGNYDPPKRPGYDPNVLTWHWDNIQIYTAAGPNPPPTTQVPPSTTVQVTTSTTPAATTTASTTTTTTNSTSTTQPTSTSSPTTSPTVEVSRASLEQLLAQLNALAAAIQAILDGG
jgi:hypothetical protein